jgi:hypothetical protein
MITFLPPLALTEGTETIQRYTYEQNRDPFAWTGYTATWRIAHRVDGDLCRGTVGLETDGEMVVTVTESNTETLVEYLPNRGMTLPGVAFEMVATDGTTTLIFQSAVSLWGAV